MPSWIHLRGDPEALTCEEPAALILKRIEEASPSAFIHFGTARLAHDDEVRTGCVRAAGIVAVMPMHPRQVNAELDDPPEWYGD